MEENHRLEDNHMGGLEESHDTYLFFAIAAAVIILDQWTKYLVATSLDLHETIVVINGFFNLTFITNTGAAFGFLADAAEWKHFMFQVVGFVALGGVFYLYKTSRDDSPLLLWGSALVFGGAAGNLIDRIRFQKVTDFLDFYMGTSHWPAFNLADSAITVGGVMMAAIFLIKKDGK